jgi:phytoene synthase
MQEGFASSGVTLAQHEHDSADLDIMRCREAIAAGSKSFNLASRVLSRTARAETAVLYAYCRRADDAVDLVPAKEQANSVARLRAELESVYAGRPQHELVLRAFASVVQRRNIPASYAQELIEGMAMDARAERYETLDALLHYCFRVAGVVGLMMCHVLGVSDPRALRRAAHLGLAMQLTNICRDVLEDAGRDRIYLPRQWLCADAPLEDRQRVKQAVARLLDEADRYYASAELGVPALPFRAALSVRTAARVYRAIGVKLRARDCDIDRGRVVVSTAKKLWLLSGAVVATLIELPMRLLHRFRPATIDQVLRFPSDVLPL